MDLPKFREEVNDMQNLLSDLKSQLETNPALVVDILETAFVNWQVTLEELFVATEALQEQHDLLVTNQIVLQDDRQRFFDMFDYAPDCYLVTDSQGIIQEANQVASQLLDRPQAHLIGKPLAQFVSGTERRIFRNLLHVLGQRRSLNNWRIHLQPLSSPFPIPVSINAITHHKRASSIRWAMRDMSQPLTLEKVQQQMSGDRGHLASQQSVDDMLTMLNYTPMACFLFNQDGTIQALNQTAQKMASEFSQGSLVAGDSLKKFLQFEQPGTFEDHLKQVFKQQTVNVQQRLYGRWFNLCYTPVIEERQVTSACLAILEVTAHKEADSEIIYQAQLLNSIPEAVIVTTPNSKVIFWNRAAEQMYGWSAEEALGRSVFELIMPNLPEMDRVSGQVLDSLYHFHQNGQPFEVELTVSEVADKLAAMTNYVTVVRDISARQKIETIEGQSQLKWAMIELQAARAELSRFSHLKDLLLTYLDHQTRTALNAIFGSSEALREQIFGPVNRQQIKQLQTITSSGQQLIEAIVEVTELCHIEDGKLTVQLEAVSVAEICRLCMELVQPLVSQKSLTLTTNLKVDQLEVQADPERLLQMLIKLLTQAALNTPDGGEIGLVVQRRDSDKEIDFIVWDTGPGIQEANMILFPFVEVTEAFRLQSQSIYLKLFLVAWLSDLHGGRLSVDSSSGEGSRFIITLPWLAASSEAEVKAEPARLSSSPYNSPLIFLAEDNQATSMSISRYLQMKGYRVVVAPNGAEALYQVHTLSPDLILMDIQMPKVDGLRVVQHLRQQPAYQKTPIILLTSLVITDGREIYLQTGANDYLSKPIHFDKLLGTIKQWL